MAPSVNHRFVSDYHLCDIHGTISQSQIRLWWSFMWHSWHHQSVTDSSLMVIYVTFMAPSVSHRFVSDGNLCDIHGTISQSQILVSDYHLYDFNLHQQAFTDKSFMVIYVAKFTECHSCGEFYIWSLRLREVWIIWKLWEVLFFISPIHHVVT